MAKKEVVWTFEQVDNHVEDVYVEDLERIERDLVKGSGKKNVVKISPEIAIEKICEVYKAVRPILMIVSTFPLLPARWKKIVLIFVRVLDSLCPVALV